MNRLRCSLLAVAALSVLPACASRYKVDAKAPTYAAQAKIKVKVNKTDNRELTVVIEHLAPPSRIDGVSRAYVVWISVPGHGITRAGQLKYNLRRRRGRLVATTPHPRFEVLVSLEADGKPAGPSQAVIVRKIVGAS